MRRAAFVHLASVVSRLLWISSLVLAVPSGFREDKVANVDSPSALDFTPDGKGLFVSSKFGQIFYFPDIQDNPRRKTTSLNIRNKLCTNGDRGMQSVLVHPDFGTKNRYVYTYYTYNENNNCDTKRSDAPMTRLSRFTLNDDNKLRNEKVILEIEVLGEYRLHYGGGMIFGNDGKIWLAVGDNGEKSGRGDPQNKKTLYGSILRINDDGSIPSDNPNAGRKRCNQGGRSPNGKPCPEVWAQGLRSPFSMNKNMNTDKTHFMIHDVGASDWEEFSEGGTKFKRADYGWKDREGPCPAHQRRNCGGYPSKYEKPVHFWEHDSDGHACASAGAFHPDGLWDGYDGVFFFADYIFGKIYTMRKGGSECYSCNPPKSGKRIETFHNRERVVAMKFGPYENSLALYYLSREGGELRRINNPKSGKIKPVAKISADKTTAVAGSTISFDATGSTASSGVLSSYKWDFDDGSAVAKGEQVEHQFGKSGKYEVVLTVENSVGLRDDAIIDISIGSIPTATIVSPASGDKFIVGNKLTLVGQAVDGLGNALDDSSLTWEIQQWHGADHYHTFLSPDTPGNNIETDTAPGPEDPYSTETSHLKVILTATDGDGFENSTELDVWPVIADIEFDTIPTGLELKLYDGFPFTMPTTLKTWVGYSLKVQAPMNQTSGGREYEFAGWSGGEELQNSNENCSVDCSQQLVVISPSNEKVVAIYTDTEPSAVTPAPAPMATSAPVTPERLEPDRTAAPVPQRKTQSPVAGSRTRGSGGQGGAGANRRGGERI